MEGWILVGILAVVWMVTAPMRATRSVMNQPGMKEIGEQIRAVTTQDPMAEYEALRQQVEAWVLEQALAYENKHNNKLTPFQISTVRRRLSIMSDDELHEAANEMIML